MSEVRDYRLELHLLVDGEATPEQVAELKALMSQDQQLAAEYLELQSLKLTLSKLSAPEAPSHAWSACCSRLNEMDRVRKTERFVGRYAWGLCGVVFCLILGGGMLNRFEPGRRIGTSDVPRLAAGLLPGSIVDHPAPSAVPQWLMQSIGSAPVRQAPAFQVIQAELGQSEQTRFARLTLQDSFGRMVLFIIPNRGSIEGVKPIDESGRFCCGRIGAMNCVTWLDGGNSLILVGARPIQQLQDAATQMSVSN